MRRVKPALSILLLSLVAFAGACSGSSSESEPPKGPASAPEGKRVVTAQAASVSGRVVFQGAAPTPAELNTDEKCAALGKPARDESVLVHDGGLENVFVYVKDGLGDYAFDVPTEPVKLDQDACVYTPHVLGVRVGQPLQVLNSDPTPHNVHAAASANQQLNTAQPFKGMVYTHSFTVPEIMVPFKCDIHPWMLAYVGVVDHPYFAVSARGGRFELKDLPAGTYTIEAWHEKFGRQTQQVTLAEKDSKELTFTFAAS